MSEHPLLPETEAKLSELNTWRKVRVDPMLDKHEDSLTAEAKKRGELELSQGLLHGKFDTLIYLAKIVIALVAIFGSLLSIIDLAGPWIRQKLGLPATYLQSIPASEPAQGKPGHQLSDK